MYDIRKSYYINTTQELSVAMTLLSYQMLPGFPPVLLVVSGSDF